MMVSTPRYSGLLQAIFKHADGTKTVLYDGAECDPATVPLTPDERFEVEQA